MFRRRAGARICSRRMRSSARLGAGLATGTAGATTNPPLTTLGGATVTVTDSAGTSQPAELLYVSSAQINYIVPDGLAAGAATVAFNSGSGIQNQTIQLSPVAPGMFTFNASGTGGGERAARFGRRHTDGGESLPDGQLRQRCLRFPSIWDRRPIRSFSSSTAPVSALPGPRIRP